VKINLLDCTLRDGGYVNNWMFGAASIAGITDALEKAKADIIELGFLRDTQPNKDSTSFSEIEDINSTIKKKNNIIYSAMIEAFNPYPLDRLANREENGVDLIRVCIWKRCMDEHMKYCKEVADKGYLLSVQPSRVEQYSDDEFIDMMKRCNELNPYSVYVVDTWGTQSSKQIEHYIEMADKYLNKNIKIGYHGHNNKQQALGCAQKVVETKWNHDICVDSSIMGMGRGAGNLNTEIIMEYLNETKMCSYNVQYVVDAFNNYLEKTYSDNRWGYSMYYYLSAIYGTNPNFATYFEGKKYGIDCFFDFLKQLTEQEKIVFDIDFVEKKLKSMKGE
jgi:4-hydroxy 2-oxovalerate aldolase